MDKRLNYKDQNDDFLVIFIKRTVLFAVILTPLFGVTEFFSMLNLSYRFEWLSKIKIIKDVTFLLMALVVIVKIFRYKHFAWGELYYITFVISLLCIGILNIYLMEQPLFLIGFRTFFPFFAVLLGSMFYKNKDLIVLERFVFFIQVLLFLLICYEYFFTKTWGVGFLGFNSRACGFFFYPSPAASFTIFSYVLHVEYGKTSRFLWIYTLIVFFLLFMISSAMGLLVFCFVLLIQKIKKRDFYILSVFLFPIGLFFLFIVYPMISGRSDFHKSIYTRFQLIVDSFLEGGLKGVAPGYGSNFFRVFYAEQLTIELPRLNDSLYASVFWQYGILPIAVLLLLMLKLFVTPLFNHRAEKRLHKIYIVMFSFLLISFSVPTNEFFPLNLLYPIVFGSLLKDYSFS